jgi:hypothetical protein
MLLVYRVVLPNRSRKKVFVPLVELLMELKKKKTAFTGELELCRTGLYYRSSQSQSFRAAPMVTCELAQSILFHILIEERESMHTFQNYMSFMLNIYVRETPHHSRLIPIHLSTGWI